MSLNLIPGEHEPNAIDAFSATPSGLFVPPSAVVKKQRILIAENFNRLRRALQHAHSLGMVMTFGCRTCREPIRLEQTDRLEATAPGGRSRLECGCSVWNVR